MQKRMFRDRFNLTNLVLFGQKTQTRDVIKIQDERLDYLRGWNLDGGFAEFGRDGEEPLRLYPMYCVGEVVAVAMRYKTIYERVVKTREYIEEIKRKYRKEKGWTNKMYVKPDSMPFTIKITNVRVKRLQDISNEDCMKEGIEKMLVGGEYHLYSFLDKKKYEWTDFRTPQEAYAALIDKINGKGTWASNPYVFIYDFELVK